MEKSKNRACLQIDMTGQRFGELTASRHLGGHAWEFSCSCGNIKVARGLDARNGRVKTCGGPAHAKWKTAPPGTRSGKIVVLSRYGKHAVCQCDCGQQVVAWANSVVSGQTKCCGCSRDQWRFRTHGLSQGRTYRIWVSMIQRTKGQSGTARTAALYAGMKVEADWLASFEAFFADMGDCPRGFSIDRIDGKNGYVRGNCRWTDIFTQNSNRSSCLFVNVHGELVTVAEASRRTGIANTTILRRIKVGWPESRWLEPVTQGAAL